MSSPQSKGPGRCVFCASLGKLTKQHVLPNQLRHIIPRLEVSHNQQLTHFTRSKDGKLVITPTSINHQGHLGTKKIRRVCRQCNAGWIKGIEDIAIPIITPLIQGHTTTLSVVDQNCIAALASTIFAMIDLTDIPASAVGADERHEILRLRAPPANWAVFAGRCDAKDWKFRFRHDGVGLGQRNEQSPSTTQKVHLCTVALQHLVLHVLSAQSPGLINLDQPSYARSMGLAVISQANHALDWSNLPILGDIQMDNLNDLFLSYGFRQ